MKIIYRYLFQQYIGPLVLTTFFAVIILLMQFLWQYVDELVGKGLEWTIILKLLFYASATFIPMALTLGVLLSSLMLFGNLGERYELVALKAAGISMSRAILPFWFLTLLIAGISFWFSNNIFPVASLKMRGLLDEVRMQKPALSIDQGVFYKEIDNFVIRVGTKERDNQTIRDIIIYDHSRRQGNNSITHAEWGEMKVSEDKQFLIFQMYNGFNWDETRSGNREESQNRLSYMTFSEQYKRLDISSFNMQSDGNQLFRNYYQMLNVAQLKHAIDSIKTDMVSCLLRLSDEMLPQNLYFFKKELTEDTLLSAHKIKKDTILQENTLLNSKEVYTHAIQLSRNISNTLKFEHEDYKYKKRMLSAHQIELHRKFSLAIACIIFFFIGAPLGSIIRKGGLAIPLVITVLFFTLYFALSMMGEKTAKSGAVEPWLGMWLSTFVIIPIALFLTYKITTDSPLVSQESWKLSLEKIKLLKRNLTLKMISKRLHFREEKV